MKGSRGIASALGIQKKKKVGFTSEFGKYYIIY
jgi:hypothetical protein